MPAKRMKLLRQIEDIEDGDLARRKRRSIWYSTRSLARRRSPGVEAKGAAQFEGKKRCPLAKLSSAPTSSTSLSECKPTDNAIVVEIVDCANVIHTKTK